MKQGESMNKNDIQSLFCQSFPTPYKIPRNTHQYYWVNTLGWPLRMQLQPYTIILQNCIKNEYSKN